MHPSIKELRERRGQLNNRFNEIVAVCESQNRDCTNQENDELARINDEDSGLVNRIRRLEEANARNEDLSRAIDIAGQQRGIVSSGGSPYVATDLDKAVAAFARNAHGRPVPADEWESAQRLGFQPGAAGMDINMNVLRPAPGREQNFFGPLNSSMSSLDVRRGGALAVGAGFSGGFEWALKSASPVLSVADVWVSEDGLRKPFPTINDTGEYGELIGEGVEASESDMQTGATYIDVFKMSSKIVRVPQELLDDAPVNLSSGIGNALGARVGRGQNRLITTNETPNGPPGLLPNAYVGVQTASSTVIAADEILDLVTAVDPVYQSGANAAFMMSPAVFGMIMKLKDSQQRYLLGDLQNGAQPKLRGWNVILNPDMPSVLSAGVKAILFGDWSKLKVRIVKQLRLRTLNETYAKTDETGFLAFLRFGSVLLDAGTHPVQALQMKPA